MTFVHVHPGAEELGRVYSPHLPIHATPTAFCAALGVLRRPALAGGGSRKLAHADYLAWTESRPSSRAASISARSWSGCAKPADRRHPVQRRRQLCGLDPPLLLASAASARMSRRASGSMGYGVPAAVAMKRPYPERRSCFARRRWRFPDERPGIRDRRAIRSAVRRHCLRQRHLRHHPHASGARISRPHLGDRFAQSGFCRLCARLRRLSASQSSGRRIFPRLQGSAGGGEARHHPPQDRCRCDYTSDEFWRVSAPKRKRSPSYCARKPNKARAPF